MEKNIRNKKFAFIGLSVIAALSLSACSTFTESESNTEEGGGPASSPASLSLSVDGVMGDKVELTVGDLPEGWQVSEDIDPTDTGMAGDVMEEPVATVNLDNGSCWLSARVDPLVIGQQGLGDDVITKTAVSAYSQTPELVSFISTMPLADGGDMELFVVENRLESSKATIEKEDGTTEEVDLMPTYQYHGLRAFDSSYSENLFSGISVLYVCNDSESLNPEEFQKGLESITVSGVSKK